MPGVTTNACGVSAIPFKTEKRGLIADCETTPNYFALGMRELEGERKTRIFELSDRSTINWDKVNKVLCSYTAIGFNWHGFDRPLLAWACQHPECTPAQIKRIADAIIGERLRPWDAEKRFDFFIPERWDSVDLLSVQPRPAGKDEKASQGRSLKAVNGRMHGRHMQDLPYAHDAILTPSQIDETNSYMLNDLDATELLWRTLKEPLALREYLGEAYGQDFRSRSDPQIGEAMMKIGVERRTGRRPYKRDIDGSKPFRYPVPPWAIFETPAFQQLVDDIRETDFWLDGKLKVVKPPSLDGRIVTLDGTEYSIGIGGIHSTEANRCVLADADDTYIDADVGSQYPAAILSLGLCPEALGQPFQDEYRSLRDTRLNAKARQAEIKREIAELERELPKFEVMSRADEIRKRIAVLKAELNPQKATDKGMKISLNGIYGKLGSPYSMLFAPHLMIGVTISCQLSILLLVERLVKAGFGIASANTDGILIRCKRTRFDGITKEARLNPCDLSEITDQWERDTGFSLEFGEFSAIYNRSVNDYFAIKADGGHKRKGAFGNPWSKHPDDYDPVRSQLMKNPTATVISDAVLALLKDGTPVEETIRACDDIRQFVTVVAVNAGATWRDRYLGKVIRYYWATDGDPILWRKPNAKGTHNQVPRTDGARPCMTLPDELPGDIDYGRYIDEAREVLRSIGYWGRPVETPKFGNLAQRKKDVIAMWSLAA